jgi:glycosyltransferase involved in cell wall biosynthesis
MTSDLTALVLSPSSVAGGAEKSLLGVAKHLPEHGVRPVFVALQDGALCDWLRELGHEVHVVEAKRTRQLLSTQATIVGIAKLGRSVGASIFLSNQPKGHVYGGLAALLARRPSVWWQLGIPQRDKLQRCAAAVPAAAIACGCEAVMVAQRRLSSRTNLVKLYPGVDVDAVVGMRGSGRAIREELGWNDNEVVGVVARLERGKGQDVFIRAIRTVADARPAARFLIVGGALLGWEGNFPQELETLAAELGLSDRLRFIGHQEDVFPWFDACDVVVNPSFGEGFGLVVVEAMALGKALVSTTAGGPAEIVEDGRSGILVPPRDAPAIAAAVLELLGDSSLRGAIEEGATQRARLFSESRSAERFAALLSEVVR